MDEDNSIQVKVTKGGNFLNWKKIILKTSERNKMIEVIKEIPCSAVEWDNCNLATNVKAQETKQSLFKNIYNKIPFNTIMRETRKKKQVVWLTTFVWRGLTLVIYCKNPEKCVCWHECSTYNTVTHWNNIHGLLCQDNLTV